MTAFCVRASEDDVLAEQIKTLLDIESFASRCDVSSRSKDDEKALQMLEQTTKFDGQIERLELLQNLIGIIFRFREQKIVITADIEAMFLQVKKPMEIVKCCDFNRETIQTNPIRCSSIENIFSEQLSPIMLCSKLQKINAQESPQITKLIKRNFSVDEFVKSVSNAEQATEVNKVLRAMLAKGGFHLTKFNSSCEQTMTSIEQADKSPSSTKPFEAELSSPFILGLH